VTVTYVAGALQVRWTAPAAPGTAPISGYAVSLDGTTVGTVGAASRGVDLTRSGGFREGRYVVGVAAVNAVGSSLPARSTVTVGDPDIPGNDDVADAQPLAGAAGSVSGDNTYASWGVDDPVAPGGFGAGGHSVWYAWTPTDDGRATMATSGGGAGRDTTLGVYTGAPGSLVQVTADDDSVGLHAAVAFDAVAGTRYLVAVDGYGTEGGTGPFALAWSQRVPSAPGGVSVAVRDRKAVVSWDAADPHGSAVTRYLVDLSKGTDRSVAGSALRIVLRNLDPGRYQVRLAARNALGDSPYSGWKRFRIR
jgi:hypothetical protein